MNLRLYATLFVFLFSLLFGIQFVYLAGGDVLNHYPFFSPDGFDWYMEGVYVVKFLGGASLPDLPVLRPPLFVFVTAADYLAGNQGLILAAIFGLAAFGTYFISLKIVDLVYEGAEKNSWYIVPLAIGTTVYSLNFIKSFILADSLAVALSLASVWLLIRYQIESKTYLLALSVTVAVLAGMTQTYALIPYLISCAIGVLSRFRLDKNRAFQFLLMIVVASLAFIFLSALWRWVLPHGKTPINFGLLKLSAGMFGFYVNTWGFYFLPFILFFILFRRYQIVINDQNLVIISSAIIILLFALLCLFYQVPDSRFTYYLWPWLMILFFSSIRLQAINGAYLISILMLMSVALVPANYWAPAWVHFKRHAAAPVLLAPADYGDLKCTARSGPLAGIVLVAADYGASACAELSLARVNEVLVAADCWTSTCADLSFARVNEALVPADYVAPTWKKVINGLKGNLALAPAYYGDPSWLFVRVEFSHNWVGRYFSALPVDRKLNTCGNDCEGEKEFLINPDPYTNATIKFYNQIKGL